MSLIQSEALVLRTYPYAESARIVVLLTRDRGQIRAIAYGARKSGTAFGSSLELLTHVRASCDVRENRDLATLKDCEILNSPWTRLENHLEASFYFHYFSELLGEFSQLGEKHDEVFRLTLAILDQCAAAPLELLARYFEVWLLKLEGLWPALDCCSRCQAPLATSGGRLAEDAGGFVCSRCGGGTGMLVTPAAIEVLATILRAHPRELTTARWPPAVRKNIEALNLKLLRYHLEKPLKTYHFIAELKSC